MGYKGAIRSIGSAVRQMERDAIRRQKELEKQRKEFERLELLEQAALEVEEYENYIDRITSIHKDCVSNVDWESVLDSPQPSEPENPHLREKEKSHKLENYRPSLINKMFGTVEKMRNKLRIEVEQARKEDDEEYKKIHDGYLKTLTEYQETIDLASQIVNGDLHAYQRAVDDMAPFEELDEIGSKLEFDFISPERVKVVLHVHDEAVVPKQTKSLLKSGKLSVKETPKGLYYETYQDYVCSTVLRIGRELFGLLPVAEIVVSAKSEILDTSTGRLELQPVLSVLLIRETMERLNFDFIDPSDSLTNFIHNMVFKKTQGMSPVSEVDFPGSDSL